MRKIGLTLMVLMVFGCTNNNTSKLMTREIDRPLIVEADKKLGMYAVGINYDYNINNKSDFMKFMPIINAPLIYRYSPLEKLEVPYFPAPIYAKYLILGEQTESINDDLNMTLNLGVKGLMYSYSSSGESDFSVIVETGIEYKKRLGEKIWFEGSILPNIDNQKTYPKNKAAEKNVNILLSARNLIGYQINENTSIKTGVIYNNENIEKHKQGNYWGMYDTETIRYQTIYFPISLEWTKENKSVEIESGMELINSEKSFPIKLVLKYYWM